MVCRCFTWYTGEGAERGGGGGGETGLPLCRDAALGEKRRLETTRG